MIKFEALGNNYTYNWETGEVTQIKDGMEIVHNNIANRHILKALVLAVAEYVEQHGSL